MTNAQKTALLQQTNNQTAMSTAADTQINNKVLSGYTHQEGLIHSMLFTHSLWNVWALTPIQWFYCSHNTHDTYNSTKGSTNKLTRDHITMTKGGNIWSVQLANGQHITHTFIPMWITHVCSLVLTQCQLWQLSQ